MQEGRSLSSTIVPCSYADRFKGDAKLSASDRVVMEKDATRHSLVVKQVVAKDAGTYSCKATNTAGTAYAAAKLKVKGQWLCSEIPSSDLLAIFRSRSIESGFLLE